MTSIFVENSGVQMTLQAGPIEGLRHLGVPDCGAADPLSLALANRLVSNPALAPAIEITFGGASFVFECELSIACTGATTAMTLNGNPVAQHTSLQVKSGDRLELEYCHSGARCYLAVSGTIQAQSFLGQKSTYLAGGIGGLEGRSLKSKDRIGILQPRKTAMLRTPDHLIPPMPSSWVLRASPTPDTAEEDREHLFNSQFKLSRRGSRIGVELIGDFPSQRQKNVRPSSAVFPGTLQLTPGGTGFLLLCDAQTTGGYPAVLQVNRSDRHLLGQLRPEDTLQFLFRTPSCAASDLRAKQALIGSWIGDFQF